MPVIYRNLPNALTCLRVLLTFPFVAAMLHEAYTWAFFIFTAAALSDCIDGVLARRYGWTSRWGSIMDPAADKLILTSAFLSLGVLGYISWLVVLAVLGRDIIIISGVLAYYYCVGQLSFRPSKISKLNTVMQLILIIAWLLTLADLIPITGPILTGLVGIVLVTTLISGVDYIIRYSYRAVVSRRIR